MLGLGTGETKRRYDIAYQQYVNVNGTIIPVVIRYYRVQRTSSSPLGHIFQFLTYSLPPREYYDHYLLQMLDSCADKRFNYTYLRSSILCYSGERRTNFELMY